MAMTKIKTPSEIQAMRESGRMLARVLAKVASQVSPGVNTQYLANIARAELKTLGGVPAFLGYHGFPDVLCVSVNDEVVHGIPSINCVIQEGDIVSLDFGVKYKGMITDSALSVIAGKAKPKDKKLLIATELSLQEGIARIKDGVRVGQISAAIEAVLDKHGYGIVRDFVGHGVGHQLHEEPNIPNYGSARSGPILKKGMTVAIEPMATLGRDSVFIEKDDWTVRTVDGSRAAHFEHTVLVTNNGVEIITTV